MCGSLLIGIAASILWTLPPPAVIDAFESEEYRIVGHDGAERFYQYRLFVPAEVDPGEAYPLIVWLHGYGREEFEEVGYGHLRHTQHLFDAAGGVDHLKAFVLAVQCPRDQRGFFSRTAASSSSKMTESQSTEPGEVTIQIVRQLLRERPIDPSRVCLVGISGGGSACWEMAMRYPDLFAGVAPLASGGGDTSRLERVVDVPFWAFHSEDDLDTPVAGVQQTVDALSVVGGTVHLTLVPGNDHDCWYFAFEDYDLFGWLMAQERGSAGARRPGTVPTPWWQTALVASGVGVVMLAVGLEVRRQRRVRVTA